jgi:hypothetical protein
MLHTFAERGQEALNQFFTCWQNQDWTGMVNHTQRTWCRDRPPIEVADHLRNFFGFKLLKDFEVTLVGSINGSDTALRANVEITYEFNGKLHHKRVEPTLLRELQPYTSSNKPGATWGINPTSILKEQDIAA